MSPKTLLTDGLLLAVLSLGVISASTTDAHDDKPTPTVKPTPTKTATPTVKPTETPRTPPTRPPFTVAPSSTPRTTLIPPVERLPNTSTEGKP